MLKNIINTKTKKNTEKFLQILIVIISQKQTKQNTNYHRINGTEISFHFFLC